MVSRENWVLGRQNYDQFEHLLGQVTAHLKERHFDLDSPFSGVSVAEMTKRFEGLELDTKSEDTESFLSELHNLYLKDAVYFNSHNYMAHLMCPVAYPAIVAEMLMGAINTSMDTWDQSAGGTLIEQKLVDWACKRIGFDPNGTPDGIFTSGGTQSNFMAMLLARDNYCLTHLNGHSVQMDGLPFEASRFRILASKVSHFSVQKAAAKMGLGYNSVIPVEADDKFHINLHDFKSKILDCEKKGLIVIAAVATIGTTDYGSVDPVNEMATICAQHNIWLHADAAYGGALIISPKNNHLVNGLQKVDSVTLDFHKSFMQPASASALVVRQAKTLSCVTHHADYLNPLSEQKAGTPNLVSKSLQTTRRFDALKLWFSLRIMGPEEIGRIFDEVIDLSSQVHNHFLNDEEIDLLHKPELSTLVFRIVKPGRNTEELNAMNYYIQKAVLHSGTSIIACTKYKGVYYLKFTFLNPNTHLNHVITVMDDIKQFANQWLAENPQKQVV